MEVELYTPAEVKELLSNMETIKRFPMICYDKVESNIEGKTAAEIMNEAKTMNYDGEWMVFRSMGVVIGLACAAVEDKTTRNLYLYDFEVATDAQGNGFSNTMLDYVYKYARQHDCQYITLMAFDDNAFEYWKHQGFRVSPKSNNNIRLLFKKL
jgi:ribosomal protein S18 acetylase RimI-like enzyme